jgi:hypothetical protein
VVLVVKTQLLVALVLVLQLQQLKHQPLLILEHHQQIILL